MSILSPITKSRQLLELLEAEISSGRFEADQAIPSQTEMAKTYGVSVTTVREALSALSQQGLIQKIQGRGAFLTDKAISGEVPVQTGVFAVMFEQMEAASPRNLPFYQPVFDGIEAMAQELGVDICLCQSGHDRLPRLIRESRVDGVIIFGHASENIQRMKSKVQEIPVVVFHSYSEMTHCIMTDDYDAGCQATKHLLGLGHRRIAFLGVEDLGKRHSKLRLQGYLDTMREFGIAVRDEWIEQDVWLPSSTPLLPCVGCGKCAACIGWETIKSKNNITAQTKKLPFTALICHNDAAAMGVINQARADGFEVPRDLSVVGFDNISREYHFSPQITSIDFSLHHLGKEAVRLLHEILAAKSKAKSEVGAEPEYSRPIMPVSLAIHASTQLLKEDNQSSTAVNN